MKKILVITLHAVKNYGSVLQTFATQKILQNLGYEVEFINYIREFNLDNNIANKVTEKDSGIKKTIKNIILIPTVRRWKTVFNTFLSDSIKLTDNVYTYDQDFISRPVKADIYCVGSDQVWNTDWNDGIAGPLYLNFIHDVPKIAFASSVGVESSRDKDKEIIEKSLKEFAGITVREKSSIPLLNSIGIDNVRYCCDPTLLLNKDFWVSFAGKKEYKKDYILICQLNHNPDFDDYAVKISKLTRKKLVRICMRYDQIRLPGHAVIIPDVKEYIRLINNASLVLTDSFHAVVFSINLNKDFLAVYPNKFNSRIEDILNNCGILDRKVSSFLDYSVIDKHIDYEEVNSRLNDIKSESLLNLKDALDCADNEGN